MLMLRWAATKLSGVEKEKEEEGSGRKRQTRDIRILIRDKRTTIPVDGTNGKHVWKVK